ncbi:MAG: tetrathionate reductase family octaheme c-type cytochrome [Melioribacteraceae bacterium]|nr:tetrathionate reductase family octaheme c-type cytochrome [Melioribacteraceae bacterium]
MKRMLLLAVLTFAVSLYAQEDHKEHMTEAFASPQAVTEACLECHETAAQEIMKTNHWSWLNEEFKNEAGETVRRGKINFINNFCIAVPSNYARCTSCHVGYGWKDSSFDFTIEKNVDCLVCHDQSGLYKKTPTAAGMPDPEVDLLKAAQSVGMPKRKNCGVCHFDGGGGTGVKHGDMDNSLYNPTHEVDVHMGGNKFECTKCHTTTEHKIGGASHGSMASNKNHVYCTTCHEGEVHKKKSLNRHTASLACETCHIPEFSREEPTKVWWDWSKAGMDRKTEKDKFGKAIFMKKKGEFVWDKNVTPTYRWYNGSADYVAIGEKIDPQTIVALNIPGGDISDKNSKLAPFKVMKGKQPYDTKNNYFIVPKLFGKGGYWKTFDWNAASELGMKEINLPYSGEFDFVETEMYWPINHMVAPKEKALKCTNCHGKKADRFDWELLGYPGDPKKEGGRVKNELVKN